MELSLNPALFQAQTVRPDPGATVSTKGKPATQADFQTFLTLLTAQLRNQDPLQPIDSTEFVAQLANFSTVEQLIGANEKLDKLSVQSTTGDIASLSHWIGREVAATNGLARMTGGPVTFQVPPLIAGQPLEAMIRDPNGAQIARFPVVPDPSGRVVWDGLDSSGSAIVGKDVVISLRRPGSDDTAPETAALVLKTVAAIRGTPSGTGFDLSDGTSLSLDEIAQLR